MSAVYTQGIIMKKLFYALALGAVVSMNAQEESLRIFDVNLNITIRDQVTQISETLPADVDHCFDLFNGQYLLKLTLTSPQNDDKIIANIVIEEKTTDGYQLIAKPSIEVTPNKEASVTFGAVQNTYGGETEQIESFS